VGAALTATAFGTLRAAVLGILTYCPCTLRFLHSRARNLPSLVTLCEPLVRLF